MSKSECWKPVVGYEQSYEVSDHGRVRSLDRVVHFTDGRKRFYRGRICKLKPHNQAGYPMAALSRGPVKQWALVHQLVMESFVGPRPFGKEVCHENGVVTDARLSNLRYDTRKGNHADTLRHGTRPQGASHHSAIYDDSLIRLVRRAAGTITEIAAAHHISRTHAWNIRNGKRRATST